MNLKYILAAVILLSLGSRPPDQFPQAEITNGLIRARLYLPDSKEGYYRGSRFDWSGVMPELEYKAHTYFGQWFRKYDPLLHDAIMGPVEDFYPIGYDEAKVGDSFLKIGIGMVKKPEEPKYFFANAYSITNGGTWKVKKKSDQVEFIQKLDDTKYAYDYKKTVQLVKNKPEMVLLHSLKNTGKTILETNVYNHNFFVMDEQLTGPDFVVTFPFKLEGEPSGKEIPGRLSENQILFDKIFTGNEHLQYTSLQGFGSSASDYDIKIENYKTGAAVRITSDQPLSRVVFWSAPKTVCPEPYIHIKINPGETFEWKIFYEFYTLELK
jgi:hypothetical protein